ncbi:hypothetical protein JTB14_000228 [Gonioctena quinquepunctata]|nr:hypothetical protein JTB14_000228 [Gonioctena quinquepunctata]
MPLTNKLHLDTGEKYIIDTPGCRIENLDVYSKEIVSLLYKVKNITCRDKPLLTYIKQMGNEFHLVINDTLLREYSWSEVQCCYITIRRHPVGQNPDNNLIFSGCVSFTRSVSIREDVVLVKCVNILGMVYENVHYIMRPPAKRSTNMNDPNVILIGIDGVSRSNLIRTMPKTFQFCKGNGWINLEGYNKIEDNTFPNLIAVLAGTKFSYHDPSVSSICDPYDQKSLNNCNFIWNQYKNYNYSTAYGEDTPMIGTFNSNKAGFVASPTDYYFRPYFLAADQLTAKYLCLKSHCTGPEKTGIRMMDLVTNFLSSVQNSTPGFGLFWMNTFSHEDVNCPTSMDDDFVEFFEDLWKRGFSQNTIFVFFSDHGFRFGKIRLTHTGRIEERLPFIHIWIPESFRRSHEELYANLVGNSKKLTSPYDLHMTLQHILSLSNDNFKENPAQGCPKYQSLFKKISDHRTCADAGISKHYCACSDYEKMHVSDPIVKEAAEFFVDRLNEMIISYGQESSGCAFYYLEKVAHAQSLVVRTGFEENILLGIVTIPEANFEGTVKVIRGEGNTFSLMEVNRLDRYAPKTFCVKNSRVQMYCYCRSLLKRFTNIFCNNKFCFLYLFVFVNFYTLAFES